MKSVRAYLTLLNAGADSPILKFNYVLRNDSNARRHRLIPLPRMTHGITPDVNVQGAKGEHLIVIDAERNLEIARRGAQLLFEKAEDALREARTIFPGDRILHANDFLPKPDFVKYLIRLARTSLSENQDALPITQDELKKQVLSFYIPLTYSASQLVRRLYALGHWDKIVETYENDAAAKHTDLKNLKELPTRLNAANLSHDPTLGAGSTAGHASWAVLHALQTTDVKHFAKVCEAFAHGDNEASALLRLTMRVNRLATFVFKFRSSYIPFVFLDSPLGAAKDPEHSCWTFVRYESKVRQAHMKGARESWLRRAWEYGLRVFIALHPVKIQFPLGLRFRSFYYHVQLPPGVNLCHARLFREPTPILHRFWDGFPGGGFWSNIGKRREVGRKLRQCFREDSQAEPPEAKGKDFLDANEGAPQEAIWESFEEDRSYTIYRNRKQILRYRHILRQLQGTSDSLVRLDHAETNLEIRIWAREKWFIRWLSVLLAISSLATALQMGGVICASGYSFLTVAVSIAINLVVLVQTHDLSRGAVLARVILLLGMVFTVGVAVKVLGTFEKWRLLPWILARLHLPVTGEC